MVSVNGKDKQLSSESAHLVEVHLEQGYEQVPSITHDLEEMGKQICKHVGQQCGWVDMLNDELNSIGNLRVQATTCLHIFWQLSEDFNDQVGDVLHKN